MRNEDHISSFGHCTDSIKDCPILVVGADGHIGCALSAELSRLGADVIETTRRTDSVRDKRLYLDLSMSIDNWILPKSIKISFFCAGVTSLIECEKNPLETSRVNVENTLSLMKLLLDAGSRVVYLSTGIVLGGDSLFASVHSEYKPSCEYSRQKVKVERSLLEWGEKKAAVIRLTKVLTPDMPLISKWIRSLRNGVTVHPFSDLVIAPISLDYLVNALVKIAISEMHGVFHVSGNKDISYADAAYFIAKKLGANECLVQAVTSKDEGVELVSIPSHTALDAKRVQMEFGIEPADVWTSISEAFSLGVVDVSGAARDDLCSL